MAYLEEDPNKQAGGNQQAGAQAGGIAQAPGVGGSTIAGSGGLGNGSATPPGSGGTFQQANLQNYVAANQGQSKTADNVQNTIGSAFNQDKSNLDSQAATAKSQADAEVPKYNLSPADAATAVRDMQAQYQKQYGTTTSAPGPTVNQYGAIGTRTHDYNGGVDPGVNAVAYQPTQDYNTAKSKLSNAANATYAGPNTFSYNFGNDTNNYGHGLQNEASYQNLLNSLYSKQNGGQGLSTGQLALQNQLDKSDPNIEGLRNKLLGQWNDLNSARDNTTSNVLSTIQSDQDRVNNNAHALRSNLQTQATGAKQAINDQVDQVNRNILNSFNGNVNGTKYADKDAAIAGIRSQLLGDLDQAYGASKALPSTAYSHLQNVLQNSDPLKLQNAWISNPVDSANPYTAQNVEGVDDQRNAYGSIMDALGLGDRMDYTPKVGGNTPGSGVNSSIQDFLKNQAAGNYTYRSGDSDPNNAFFNLEDYLQSIGLT